MAKIHVLPEIIANKIAAGEVVERPASIVKELIENSLDAGATQIDVVMQHAGKSLIRVADNGAGMSREDASLAIQRHATSKVEVAEDLEQIQSFGFRGEALPSIAAVSRMRLRTREKGSPFGVELLIEGGVVQGVEECSCREGTIIEIRDLFFNTPARRKFLRSEATERGHIVDVVSNFALAMTAVKFSLTSGERKIWDFAPNETLLNRAVQSFGLNRAEDLLAFSDEEKGVRVSGLIGKAQVARANRSSQIFYVNRRQVKAIPLSFALQAGYHGLLMHGQHAVAVVFIEVDPAQVDVNVHPTKQEVRLSNERLVKSLLKRAVAARLGREEDMAPFLQPTQASRGEQHGTKRDERWNLTEVPVFNAPPQERALSEPISLRNKLHITKLMGQIHGTYILAETETGFVLIDQHAAHERVMFEELMQGLQSGQAKKQGLLLNEVLTLQPKQEAVLQECLPVIEKLGFELDKFGENEFVIRAVPATLSNADPIASLQRFLDQKEAGKMVTDLESHPEEIAALIACKRRSVKAHDRMTPEAMQSLLEQLAVCDYPFSCPHGRPAFFKMNLDELEKQFKRKV